MSAPYASLALFVAQARDDDAYGKAEEVVQPAHPFGVTLGEVVVDGNDVDALAFQRVQDDGESGDEGLAFACFHFSNLAVVQSHRAEQLHIVMPHTEHAGTGLADQGEHFGENGVQILFPRFAPVPYRRPSAAAVPHPQGPAFRAQAH